MSNKAFFLLSMLVLNQVSLQTCTKVYPYVFGATGGSADSHAEFLAVDWNDADSLIVLGGTIKSNDVASTSE